MYEKLNEIVVDYRDVLEVVVEGEEEEKNIYLEGIFGQSETWNRNKRWYQKKELISEVDRFNREVIPVKRALDELDHSQESDILLSRSSHIFEKVWMDGNDMCARARIMNTVNGKTLKIIIQEGVPFGVSTKALGILSKTKKCGQSGNLVSKLKLRSIGDAVFTQSAPQAIPDVIIEMLMENDERIRKIFGQEAIYNAQKIMKSTSASQLDEKTIEIYNKLMKINV